jgi:hypothetical protein
VGRRTGLDAVANRKSRYSWRESNSSRSSRSLVTILSELHRLLFNELQIENSTVGLGIVAYIPSFMSRHSSVGIALAYGLDDRGSRIRFPAGAANFSLHHRVQDGCGAHPVSYPMDTRGSFPRVKAAGA